MPQVISAGALACCLFLSACGASNGYRSASLTGSQSFDPYRANEIKREAQQERQWLSWNNKSLHAVANVALATTLWVAAGGCKVAGCLPGYRCNPDTELCERIEQAQKQGPLSATPNISSISPGQAILRGP